MFRKADALQARAYVTLDAKALQLTDSAQAPQAPSPEQPQHLRLDDGARPGRHLSDLLHQYAGGAKRSAAFAQAATAPQLQFGASYGLTAPKNASPAALAFIDYLLSPQGQAVLRQQGSAAP